MNIDPMMVLASFGIGIVVGLTGMGGGALMTPVLVLFFGIPPLTAVSSDLVAAAVMKPVGSFVHLRRGTVSLGLVKWLVVRRLVVQCRRLIRWQQGRRELSFAVSVPQRPTRAARGQYWI